MRRETMDMVEEPLLGLFGAQFDSVINGKLEADSSDAKRIASSSPSASTSQKPCGFPLQQKIETVPMASNIFPVREVIGALKARVIL